MPDMTAEASRAQAREELERIVRVGAVDGDTLSETADHLFDALPRLAGLLGYVKADGELLEEWGVQFERQADPTMDNPSGIVTNTTTVSGRSHAEQCVQNGAPISAKNRRVVRRTVGPWEVVE